MKVKVGDVVKLPDGHYGIVVSMSPDKGEASLYCLWLRDNGKNILSGFELNNSQMSDRVKIIETISSDDISNIIINLNKVYK